MIIFGSNEYIVTGRESFVCTFEDDTSCLLTNEKANTTEMWEIDDGHGLVKDNSLNIGL